VNNRDVKWNDFAYPDKKGVVPQFSSDMNADQLRALAEDPRADNAALKEIVGHGKVDSITLGLVAVHASALDDTLKDVVFHRKADANAVRNVRDHNNCKDKTHDAAILKLGTFRRPEQAGGKNPFFNARLGEGGRGGRGR
jgi:hypothetical protein